MDILNKLSQWGAVHAAARQAERAAADAAAPDADARRRDALHLRERADSLHREVYRDLDRRERPA